MSALPDDARPLRVFLARCTRRLSWIAAAQGAAAGFAGALGLTLALFLATLRGGPPDSFVLIALGLAALGLTIGVVVSIRRPGRVAHLVERRAPHCRNLIITAAELLERPDSVRPYIGERVQREAARTIGTLDPETLFPARRAITALAVSGAVWASVLALVVLLPAAPALSSALPGSATQAAAITRVDVSIAPPAYTARPDTVLRDPARIEVLAGSRIRLTVRANADGLTLETMDGRQNVARDGDNTVFTAELSATEDGYIALEPTAADGRAGLRRLIGLSVTPDLVPRVRVTAPARDLFIPDAKRAIDVTLEADDDLALAALSLRYTKVSGSGEQFTFTDGNVPLDVARSDDRTWKARGVLRLDALGLTSGDMVVYRGVAMDRRPGAASGESDAYIVEITSPGAIAAEGFALDDEQDRYALSQQMVILKTERLIARAPRMTSDSVAYAALALGAEQRAVRALFVFMMGGELAEEILADSSMADLNEVAHAEADDEAIAGRLANQGRVALLSAIRAMSRAGTSLNAANLPVALAEEKLALGYLQRAFSRTRYILRALTQRERLDLSRRLTGVLSAVGSDVRPVAEPAADARVVALRRALAGVAGLAGAAQLDANAATTASRLAAAVLQVDPSAQPLQEVAAQLNDAAVSMSAGRGEEARRQLDRAATLLVAALKTDLANAPPRASSLDVNLLRGALRDALRQRQRLP